MNQDELGGVEKWLWSTCCSFRGPGLSSQNTQGSAQLPATPASGRSDTSGLHGHLHSQSDTHRVLVRISTGVIRPDHDHKKGEGNACLPALHFHSMIQHHKKLGRNSR